MNMFSFFVIILSSCFWKPTGAQAKTLVISKRYCQLQAGWHKSRELQAPEGVARGFYWYDSMNHALSLIREANRDTESMLLEASRSAGGHSCPQILIILAARFQRVSWKYQSIAYALILKNVGVIYATMYLVATAMGLAPCALGGGDSDCFTKLSGTDYLKETSVGEFLLGSKLRSATSAALSSCCSCIG
jgi:SagB-type dehydrogenase family enzyme